MFGDVIFNIDHGYLEGLVRGFKSGILKHQDYMNLVQCETLEGLTHDGFEIVLLFKLFILRFKTSFAKY
jgi:hypothetical protein